jgi:hypothetical protein
MNAPRHVCRLVGLAAVLVLSASSTAAARPDGGHGTRHVHFTSTSQVVGGSVTCDPTAPTRCAGTFQSVRTFAGDIEGTAYVVGSAVLLRDGTYQGQDLAQFTGTIEGCGSGTLLMIDTGIFDPATADEHGTWTITAGQGTGDLAQVSGSGTADTRAGGATGAIRCHNRDSLESARPDEPDHGA